MMRDWYNITDSAEDVTIEIYGDIGSNWWDDNAVNAKQLLDAIKEANNKPISLHINSGGGNVFDAFAMMTSLADHPAKVTAYVDGIAASAASFLLAAADEVVMASEAWLMIHEASGACTGTASDMRESADWMDRVNDQLAGIYAKRTGRDKQEFVDAMSATTWYTAEDALDWGLADRLNEVVKMAAAATREKTTINTAPEAARVLLGECDKKPIDNTIATAAALADGVGLSASYTTSIITASNTDEGQEAHTPAAQERVVVFDYKIYRSTKGVNNG